MRIKVLVGIGAVIAVVGAFGAGVAASSSTVDGGASGLDRQAWRSRSGPFTTSSESFIPLSDPGVTGDERLTVLGGGSMTVIFSGDFSSAPVELRGNIDGRQMQPGVATFDPTDATTSFSFTFSTRSGSKGCHHLGVDWRSPTGEEVTFNHGSFVVLYNHWENARVGCV